MSSPSQTILNAVIERRPPSDSIFDIGENREYTANALLEDNTPLRRKTGVRPRNILLSYQIITRAPQAKHE
jgi:hypothetical protein